jgi:hypothetical protein
MENELVTRARDVAYTAVGFGVLAVQGLQVKRRDLAKDVAQRLDSDEVRRFVRKAQVALDPVLDVVEARLPLPSRVLFHQARRVARNVQASVLR